MVTFLAPGVFESAVSGFFAFIFWRMVGGMVIRFLFSCGGCWALFVFGGGGAGFGKVVWGWDMGIGCGAALCVIFEGAVIGVGLWGGEEGSLERLVAVRGRGFETVGSLFCGMVFAGADGFGFVVGGMLLFDGVGVVLFVGFLIGAGRNFMLGLVEVVDDVATLGRIGVFGVAGVDLIDAVLVDRSIFLRGAPAALWAVRMGTFAFRTCVVSGRLRAFCTDGFTAAMYCCNRFLCAADGVMFACMPWRLATDGILVELEFPFAFSSLSGFFVDASSRTRESGCCCCAASPIIFSKSSGFWPP